MTHSPFSRLQSSSGFIQQQAGDRGVSVCLWFRKSILVLWLCFCAFGLTGQSAISASLVLGPGSPFLEDYADPGRFLVTLVSTDQRPSYQVRLEVTVSSGRQTWRLGGPTVRPRIFTLFRNQPLVLQGGELTDLLSVNAMSPGERTAFLNQGNRLAEGAVTFCVAAYDATLPGTPPVSNTACALGLVRLHQPPLLLTFPGEEVRVTSPQSVPFQWIPQQPFPARYTLQIWEDDLGFSDDILTTSIAPYVQVETFNNPYLLTDFDPLLLAGRRYAYRVRATDPAGRERFINDGFSTLERFVYRPASIEAENDDADIAAADCPPPAIFPDWTPLDHGTVTIDWTPDPANLPLELTLRQLDGTAMSPGTQLYPATVSSVNFTGLIGDTDYEIELCTRCADETAVSPDRSNCVSRYFHFPALDECEGNLAVEIDNVDPRAATLAWTTASSWPGGFSLRINGDTLAFGPEQRTHRLTGLREATEYPFELCLDCLGTDGVPACITSSFWTSTYRCPTEAELAENLNVSVGEQDEIRADWSTLPPELLAHPPRIRLAAVPTGEPAIVNYDFTATATATQDHHLIDNLDWSEAEQLELQFCLDCDDGTTICTTRLLDHINCDSFPDFLDLEATRVGSDYAELHWSLPSELLVDSFYLRYGSNGTPEADYTVLPATTDRHYRIPDLSPRLTYQVEVCFNCGAEQERCTGIAVTTEGVNCSEAGQFPLAYVCGADGTIDYTGGVPLIGELYPGDSVWAGDFLVHIETVDSGPPWKGTGRMVVPYLNEAVLGVTFDTIQINENCRMVSGQMEVISPYRELLESLSELVGDFNAAINQISRAVDQVRELVNQIDDWLNQGSELAGVMDRLNEIAGQYPYLPPEVAEQLSEATDCLNNTPPAQRDSLCRDVVLRSLDALDAALEQLFDADFQANFRPAAGMTYGFDALTYPEMNTNGWYPATPDINGRDYTVAWKSAAAGATDRVLVQTDPNGYLAAARFETADSTAVGEPALDTLGGDGKVLTLDAAAFSKGTVFALHAGAPDSLGRPSSKIAGQLSLVTYPAKALEIVFVRVNGADPAAAWDETELEQELNRIFGPAIVEVDVELYGDALSVPTVGDEMSANASGIRSYNQDMRQVIRAYDQAGLAEQYGPDAYVIFLLAAHAEDKAGFMPRKRPYGFVFLDECLNGSYAVPVEEPAQRLARTVAHELGHGAYHLQHVWEEVPSLPNGTTPDNLMSYQGGNHLHKWQWDLIDQPVRVRGLFEGDEEGSGEAIYSGWKLHIWSPQISRALRIALRENDIIEQRRLTYWALNNEFTNDWAESITEYVHASRQNKAATLRKSPNIDLSGLTLILYDFVDANNCITNDSSLAISIIKSEAHYFPAFLSNSLVEDEGYPVDIKLYTGELTPANGNTYYGEYDFIGWYTESSFIMGGNGVISGRIRGYGYLEFMYSISGYTGLPAFTLYGAMYGKSTLNNDPADGFPSSATISTFVGDGLSVSYTNFSAWSSYNSEGDQTWYGESISLIDSDMLVFYTQNPVSLIPGFLGQVIDLFSNFSSTTTHTSVLNDFYHQGGASNIYYHCSYED